MKKNLMACFLACCIVGGTLPVAVSSSPEDFTACAIVELPQLVEYLEVKSPDTIVGKVGETVKIEFGSRDVFRDIGYNPKIAAIIRYTDNQILNWDADTSKGEISIYLEKAGTATVTVEFSDEGGNGKAGTIDKKFTIIAEENEEEEKDDTLYGDFDDNGRIDAWDSEYMMGYIINYEKAPSFNVKAADVNKDGKVDIGDVVLVNKWLYDNRNVSLPFVPTGNEDSEDITGKAWLVQCESHTVLPGEYVQVNVMIQRGSTSDYAKIAGFSGNVRFYDDIQLISMEGTGRMPFHFNENTGEFCSVDSWGQNIEFYDYEYLFTMTFVVPPYTFPGTQCVIDLSNMKFFDDYGRDISEHFYTVNGVIQVDAPVTVDPAWTTTTTTKATTTTTTTTTTTGTMTSTKKTTTTTTLTTGTVTSTKKTTATTSTTATTTEQKELQVGDANGDNAVNIADATAIVQFIANPDKYNLTEAQRIAADVYNTGDGVTPLDAYAIQLLEAGSITSLPFNGTIGK